MTRSIRCSVPCCDNIKYWKEKDTNRPDLIFFSFPRDRKSQWALAIGRPDFVLKNTCYSGRRVCSEHFQESDFEPDVIDNSLLEHRKRLRRDAIPSLLLPKDGEIKRRRKKRKLGATGSSSLAESTTVLESGNEVVSTLSPQSSPPYQNKNLLQTVENVYCLICSEATSTENTGASCLPGMRYKFDGSSNLHLLNQQLWSTFILRKILELPAWKYEDILKTAGESSQPSEWFLVCVACSRTLIQLLEMEEKIKVLEEETKKLRNKLQKEFRRSLETDIRVQNQNNKLAVGEAIRNFFKKNWVQCTEVKEEPAGYEFHDEEDNSNQSDYISESGAPLSLPSKDFEVVNQEEEDAFDGNNSSSEASESSEQVDQKDLSSTSSEAFNKIASSLHPNWKPQKTLQCSPKPNESMRKDILAKVKKAGASIKASAAKHFDCSQCGLPLLNFGALSKHYRIEHKKRLDKRWKDAKASSLQENYLTDLPTKSTPEKKHGNRKLTFKKQSKALSKKKRIGHIDKNIGETNFQCSECEMSFSSANGLRIHTHFKHTGKERSMCEICGFKDLKHLLEKHIFNHKIFDDSVDPTVSTTEFICSICKQLFKTRRQLTSHKVNNHAEELGLQVYQCSYCPRKFSKKEILTYHEMRIHQKRGRYPCDKCDYEAMSKTFLEKHKSKHLTTLSICEYCSATYHSEANLRQHIQRYHPENYTPMKKKKFFVGVAVDKLSTEGSEPSWNFILRQKQRDQKPIDCKYCKEVLPHKLAFNLHLKESHKDKYKYLCDLCDKKYLSIASLQLHKKINHKEKGKSVKCAWCLKTVTHRLYLYSHVKVCPKKPKDGDNIPKIMAIDENNVDLEDNICAEGQNETVA